MAKKQQDGSTAVADAPADFVDPALASTAPPAADDVEALKARIRQLEAQMGTGGKAAFVAPNQPLGCKFWKVKLQEFKFHGEEEVCVQADDAANALAKFYERTGIIASEFVPTVLPSAESEFNDQQKRLEASAPAQRLVSPLG
jgi:hypothetical protein